MQVQKGGVAPGRSWVGGADQASKADAPPQEPGIGNVLPSRNREEPFSSQAGDHAAVGGEGSGVCLFPPQGTIDMVTLWS